MNIDMSIASRKGPSPEQVLQATRRAGPRLTINPIPVNEENYTITSDYSNIYSEESATTDNFSYSRREQFGQRNEVSAATDNFSNSRREQIDQRNEASAVRDNFSNLRREQIDQRNQQKFNKPREVENVNEITLITAFDYRSITSVRIPKEKPKLVGYFMHDGNTSPENICNVATLALEPTEVLLSDDKQYTLIE